MSKRWQVGLQLKHVQEVHGSVWDAGMGKACRGHGWDQDERACLFFFAGAGLLEELCSCMVTTYFIGMIFDILMPCACTLVLLLRLGSG